MFWLESACICLNWLHFWTFAFKLVPHFMPRHLSVTNFISQQLSQLLFFSVGSHETDTLRVRGTAFHPTRATQQAEGRIGGCVPVLQITDTKLKYWFPSSQPDSYVTVWYVNQLAETWNLPQILKIVHLINVRSSFLHFYWQSRLSLPANASLKFPLMLVHSTPTI